MIPQLELPRGAARLLGRAALRSAPAEAGGLLLGRRLGAATARVALATRAENVARGSAADVLDLDPGHLVRMVRRGERRGLTLLGAWHSHPDGPAALALSAADIGLVVGEGWLLVARARPFGLVAWRCRGGRLERGRIVRGGRTPSSGRALVAAAAPQ